MIEVHWSILILAGIGVGTCCWFVRQIILELTMYR